MDLKQRIVEDMKAAMRAGDSRRRDAVRLLQAAIKQREIDTRTILDDQAVIAVIEKMLKQRKDAILQYESAQRFDLSEKEKFEIEVLGTYMPEAMDEGEIKKIVEETIVEIGAKDLQDMGKVMAALKSKLAGRADMTKVSMHVKEKITG